MSIEIEYSQDRKIPFLLDTLRLISVFNFNKREIRWWTLVTPQNHTSYSLKYSLVYRVVCLCNKYPRRITTRRSIYSLVQSYMSRRFSFHCLRSDWGSRCPNCFLHFVINYQEKPIRFLFTYSRQFASQLTGTCVLLYINQNANRLLRSSSLGFSSYKIQLGAIVLRSVRKFSKWGRHSSESEE